MTFEEFYQLLDTFGAKCVSDELFEHRFDRNITPKDVKFVDSVLIIDRTKPVIVTVPGYILERVMGGAHE